MRLKAARSCLVVTSFLNEGHPDTPCPDWLLANIALLTTAAQRLDVPLFMAHGNAAPIESLAFRLSPPSSDARSVPGFATRECNIDGLPDMMRRLGRKQALFVGSLPIVQPLIARLSSAEDGCTAYAVIDAIADDSAALEPPTLDRMRKADCPLVTTEMAVFEWLERGDTPIFRELLPLIKRRALRRDFSAESRK
ncbi:MAG: hypothetical protein GEU87_12375 [Alphaproteobacteria bacterium]|nr:hypothetical protein [Alphaproteobacteria bacterium]